jgi:hypothetical protein
MSAALQRAARGARVVVMSRRRRRCVVWAGGGAAIVYDLAGGVVAVWSVPAGVTGAVGVRVWAMGRLLATSAP